MVAVSADDWPGRSPGGFSEDFSVSAVNTSADLAHDSVESPHVPVGELRERPLAQASGRLRQIEDADLTSRDFFQEGRQELCSLYPVAVVDKHSGCARTGGVDDQPERVNICRPSGPVDPVRAEHEVGPAGRRRRGDREGGADLVAVGRGEHARQATPRHEAPRPHRRQQGADLILLGALQIDPV